MASDGLYDRLYREAQARLAGILQGEEREIIKSYGAALLSIRKELKAIYDRYAADGKLTNGEMSKYNRLVTVQDRIEEILKQRLKQVDSLTRRLTAEQYRESFYRHAYAIDQAGGMALSWGQIPEDAVKAAVESGYSKLASSRAMARSRSGTVEKVRREIALSVIRGDSYDTLARRISDALGVRVAGRKAEYTDRGAAARSLTVARTEGQRVLAEGQAEVTRRAAELGCEIETVWDATLDGRTRPAHGALDGRPKDDQEKGWNVPGIGWVSAPLHSGVASFDINCRCRMRDQIKGYPPEERYARGDGMKPYQTYTEWKKEKTTIRGISKASAAGIEREGQDAGQALGEVSLHCLGRMEERGIALSDVEDTLLNPLKTDIIKTDASGKRSQKIYGEKITLVRNPDTGVVITAYPTSARRLKKIKKETEK